MLIVLYKNRTQRGTRYTTLHSASVPSPQISPRLQSIPTNRTCKCNNYKQININSKHKSYRILEYNYNYLLRKQNSTVDERYSLSIASSKLKRVIFTRWRNHKNTPSLEARGLKNGPDFTTQNLKKHRYFTVSGFVHTSPHLQNN